MNESRFNLPSINSMYTFKKSYLATTSQLAATAFEDPINILTKTPPLNFVGVFILCAMNEEISSEKKIIICTHNCGSKWMND
jgi:hypothetical protein